ncbi:TIGR03086 family metal-binding protein [Streptomyces palmae]|uniref:TIGR03086 family protein n=1 Tax=Streptomyces palmae TaxID=1701085 RepID=A0A4Z0HFK2_9ACTN|nr:TIGR03086 family metal-binding protein [Streptomyces palmae]TGB15601.1 TIGR03086 family protein [Streptomyces palmae]
MRAHPVLTRYVRVLSQATGVVREFPVGRWEAPSPCEGWTARQVLGHLVDGQRQVASLITGQGPLAPLADPADALSARKEPAACWLSADLRMRGLLETAEPAAEVMTPQGRLTVEAVLAAAVIEPLVHAWDLAESAGVGVTLDAEAVESCLAAIAPVAERFAATGMYAPALPAPPGADPQQRLLALLGRRTA